MKISIDGWDFLRSTRDFLEREYNIDLDWDINEIHVNVKFINKPNLFSYEKTEKWNKDKLEYDVLENYDVEGLFVKRKKFGSKKYEYVKFDYNKLIDNIEIGPNEEIDINIY